MDWKPEMFLEECDDESPAKNSSEETKKKIDEIYLLPFKFGWTREIHYRADNSGTCDIYYVPPGNDDDIGQGKKKERGDEFRKRRSMIDQEKYFQDFPSNDLSALNFTFTKNILGLVSESFEVIRGLPKRCDVRLLNMKNVKLKKPVSKSLNVIDSKDAEKSEVVKKKVDKTPKKTLNKMLNVKLNKIAEKTKVAKSKESLKKVLKETNIPKERHKNGLPKKVAKITESSAKTELPKDTKNKSGSEAPKAQTKESSEPVEPSFVTGTSRTGRVRKEKKIFDL